MLRKQLFSDCLVDARLAVASPDMRSKGVYLSLYSLANTQNSVDIETMRSDADFISTSRHHSLGDTDCVNLQVDALITPRQKSESSHSLYLDCDFDGKIAEYTSARKAGYTQLSTYGLCDYSSLKDVVYVTPQTDFGWFTSVVKPNTGYDLVTRTAVRFEFVPFGDQFAVVKTAYSAITYLPKYPTLSSATCNVSVWYAQCPVTGPKVATIGPTKVLTASGSSAAFYAIEAYMNGRTSDPTGYAEDLLKVITPIQEVMPPADFSRHITYDPSAFDPLNFVLAKARLSNAGIICARDSLVSDVSYAEWADLADTAVDDCHYIDTNSIAYLRDFRKTFGEVKDAYKVIRNPFNLKAWANLWLGLRFGTRLAVADTKSILTGTQRAIQDEQRIWNKKFQVVRSRSTQGLHPSLHQATGTRSLNYKVYYKPKLDIGSRALKAITDVGLFPTSKNLWDLVPLSFVVDWFANVSGVLESIDRQAYEQYITILGSTYSFKDEYIVPVSLTDLGFEDTSCVVHFYVRQHRPSIHQSYLRLTTGHLSTINVVDGLTLLLQRKTK